jgi:hypothetical protein
MTGPTVVFSERINFNVDYVKLLRSANIETMDDVFRCGSQ